MKTSNGHCTIPDYLARRVFKDPVSGKFAVQISLQRNFFIGVTMEEFAELKEFIDWTIVVGWRDDQGKFRVAVRSLEGGWGFGQDGYALKPFWKVRRNGSCVFGGMQVFTFDEDGSPMSEVYGTNGYE